MRPFLSLLRSEEQRDLLAAGTVRRVPAQAEVYVEDHRSTKVVILLSAYVTVLSRTRDGEQWVAYRGPGDILGELSLVDGLPHSATVRVVRGGRVVVLSYEAFDQVLRRHDGIRTALLRVVVHRLRTIDRNGGVRQERALVRVGRLLERAEQGDGSEASVGTPFRFQHQIAEMLGLSRSSVVRALTELRARGLVTTRHGSIRVLDSNRLAAFLAHAEANGDHRGPLPDVLPDPSEPDDHDLG